MRFFTTLTSLLISCLLCGLVYRATGQALPLRYSDTYRGNFILIGNTLGQDAADGVPSPVVGTVGTVGTNTSDTAPDVFWRSDSPTSGQAEANTGVTAANARSAAQLTIPTGAVVKKAYLYWAAGALATAPTGPLSVSIQYGTTTSTSLQSDFFSIATGSPYSYQAGKDITDLVVANGSGKYTVSGVLSPELVNVDNGDNFAGWSMVVFYELSTDPVRALRLNDGMIRIANGSSYNATFSDFGTIKPAGFGGKLGIVTYEGDNTTAGDVLSFNGRAISDAQNPANNFSNGTRSTLGLATSMAGDLPQLTGGAGSMSGIDLDIFDITSYLSGGQSAYTVSASSSDDVYYAGVLVSAIGEVIPPVPVVGGLAASPDPVCAGNPLSFTATVGNVTGTYTYTLTNGSSLLSGTASTAAFSQTVPAGGLGPQTFTLTVSANGQSAAATTTLTVNAPPTVSITANPSLTITQGSSTTLTASGATTYRWSTSETTAAILASTAGPYSVTGTTGVCSTTASVVVSVRALPCGAVVYVTPGGAGLRDGSSWTNAFPGTALQTAINTAAGCGAQVWVAGGTYKPTGTPTTPGTDRNASFALKNGVTIYGGFPASGNPGLAERNPASFTTILSGDIDNDGTLAGNSYHVFTNNNLDNTAVLDGFVVTGGNGVGAGFPGNLGGAFFNGNSSPRLINCLIQNNQSGFGGAFFNGNSNPVLTNCALQSNTATGNGGAFANNAGFPVLINCTLLNNMAAAGGAFYNENNGSPVLTNSIMWNNGGANSIGNSSGRVIASYSLLDNTSGADISGPGNLTTTTSPFSSANSVALAAGSVVIDAGNPASVTVASGPYSATNLPRTDLAGNPRIVGCFVDMGAVEYQNNAPPARLYVNASQTATTANGLTWQTAFPSLQTALTYPCSRSLTEIWVAAGTYKPTTSTTDRNASFAMKSGVAIYGGFVGTEASLSDRHLSFPSSTTLSGDIDNDGTLNGSNSFHVINNPGGTDNTAILNGFVITGGRADGSVNNAYGGGMLNSANGNADDYKNPTVINCLFADNYAASYGGAIRNENSSPVLINCAFLNNTSGFRGGAISNNIRCSPVLTNCSFQGNSAFDSGQALDNSQYCNATLTNCVLWNNGSGNAISNSESTLTISYSLFAPGDFMDGTGNRSTASSPFASTTSVAFNACSPGIDAGSNSAYTSANGPTTDLSGQARFYNNTSIDMGAIEYQGTPNLQTGFTTQLASGSAVCVGARVTPSVSVSGTGPFSYQWYKDGAAVNGQTSAMLSLTNVQTSDAGSYSVVVTGTCNSVTSTAFSLTVNSSPTLIITANPSLTIAQGTSAQLTASGATSYSWSSGQSTSAISVSVANTYSVTGTTSGCSATAMARVTVVNLTPTLAGFTATPNSACVGSVVTFTAAVGNLSGAYDYTLTSGSITLRGSSTSPVFSQSLLASGASDQIYIYRLLVSQSGQTASQVTTLTVNPLPLATLSASPSTTLTCAQTSLSLTAGSGSTYSFSGPALVSQTGNQAVINKPGTYTLLVTATNGCSAATTLAIGQNLTPPAPPTLLTASGQSSVTAIQNTPSVVLQASGCSGMLKWSGPNSTTGTGNITVSTAQTGQFVYTATCQVGSCVSSPASATVTVQLPPTLLSVSHQDADFNLLTSNVIRPYLQLNNEGTTPIPYGEITVRYWLTVENFAPMTNLAVYYAQLGTDKVKIKYVELPQPRQGALGYLEYSFLATAGNLAPNSNSGPIQNGIGKQDWTNFNEGDDYSYANNRSYAKNSRITAYRNGSLIWGTEPAVVSGVQSLKVSTENKLLATTNVISTFLQLNNVGNVPVNYGDLKVRYYFTSEGSQPLNFYLDYAVLGNANVKGQLVKINPPLANADTYLELSFTNLSKLYPLSGTGNIQYRIAKADWSFFNQANDYSYQNGLYPMAENNRVVVYLAGQRVYGTEPGAGGRLSAEPSAATLTVTVLGNPVAGNELSVEVCGAEGQPLHFQLTDLQGQPVSQHLVELAGATKYQRFDVSSRAAGVLLLQVSTPSQRQTVKVLIQR